ncbi:uncharacterized protein PRCAT00002039001 [Priceomyces carsonii]|uniref:uncharacterized protein n=1 Tax=Priceomyces carsonii TaxID=28549 RepID=UPI002ED82855|nr:unnamed protein product [Priceomyces carsonii]
MSKAKGLDNEVNGYPLKTHDLEAKSFYIKVINKEFRNLQLDKALRSKSIFDLIDYCELLYEQLSATRDKNDAIRLYVKGFLIFNYFINSFIMVHFHGFDAFIESNEQDFIIYLNVFAFYVNKLAIENDSFTIPLEHLRRWMLEYLMDNDLLNFDVKELYEWLFEYIDYLKNKDNSLEENSDTGRDLNSLQEDPCEYTNSHLLPKSDKIYNLADINLEDSTISSNSQYNVDPVKQFVNRYPSVKLEKEPISTNETYGISFQRYKPSDSISTLPDLPQVAPPAPPLASYQENVYSSTPYPVDVPPKRAPYPIRENSYDDSTFIDEDLNGSLKHHLRSNGESSTNVLEREKEYHRPQHPYNLNKRPPIAVPSQINASGVIPYKLEVERPQVIPAPSVLPFNGNGSRSGSTSYVPPVAQQLLIGISPHFGLQYNNNSDFSNGSYPSQSRVNFQAPQNKSQKVESMKEYAICGLKNFGSSCYINLTIQLLFGLLDFKSVFHNLEYQKYIRDPKYVDIIRALKMNKNPVLLSEAISSLLKVFESHGSASIAPTKFLRVTSLLKPDFHIPHEQQDAQEFLLFILERLHEELSCKVPELVEITDDSIERYISKWNIVISQKDKEEYFKWYKSLIKSEGDSPIHDLFQGHLQNKLICFRCKYESINYSPFTILSLPIPNKHGESVDLSDCLKYYIQDEVLTGDNAWNCPKCSSSKPLDSSNSSLDNHPVFNNKKSGIFKFSRRAKSPSRDVQKTPLNPTEGSISIKTLDFIKLPQVLFIHLSRFSMFNVTDKLDTKIQYPLELKFKNHNYSIGYKLTGLINHYGNLKSGHYTSLVNKSVIGHNLDKLDNLKHPYWCLFDDDCIRVNMFHGDINHKTHNSFHSRDVYVLCYERTS